MKTGVPACDLSEQPVQYVYLFYPVVRGGRHVIHREQIFRIMVFHRLKRGQFAIESMFVGSGISYLIVFPAADALRNEINFGSVRFSYVYFITSPEKFKVHDIF